MASFLANSFPSLPPKIGHLPLNFTKTWINTGFDLVFLLARKITFYLTVCSPFRKRFFPSDIKWSILKVRVTWNLAMHFSLPFHRVRYICEFRERDKFSCSHYIPHVTKRKFVRNGRQTSSPLSKRSGKIKVNFSDVIRRHDSLFTLTGFN